MKKLILSVTAAALFSLAFFSAGAQTVKTDTSKAGAAQDTSAKDLTATLASASDFSMLSTALKATGLDASLKGAGPFTIFAPNNDDFNALPKSTLDSLMKDPVRLAVVLKAHVISGKFDKGAIIKALVAGKGKATLTTIGGETLVVSVKDKKLVITGPKGTVVEVITFDVPCTNGVIHIINGVLLTK